jgi:Flp pilus assembly protein TadG
MIRQLNSPSRSPASRIAHRRAGSATLETALVLMLVLLPLTYGMIEFSYYFYTKHTIQGAAREGARMAILPDATNAKVTSAIDSAMTLAGLQNSGYTVTLSPSNVASAAPGAQVSVVVECNWSTVWTMQLMNGVSFCQPKDGKVRGMTVMRKEG